MNADAVQAATEALLHVTQLLPEEVTAKVREDIAHEAEVAVAAAEPIIRAKIEARLAATRAVLAYRERELLDLKGPCSRTACRLHYAHSGPCDIAALATEVHPDWCKCQRVCGGDQ